MKTAVKQNTELLHLLNKLEEVVDMIRLFKNVENYKGGDFNHAFKLRIQLTRERVGILRKLEMLIN